jgi:hypothetical protein
MVSGGIMATPDELMSVESDEKNIIIKLPIDLLVHSQGFRDSGYLILDEKSMAEYFKKMFLHSNRRQYSDVGSDFEVLLDDFFDDSFENGEVWLNSLEEMDLNDDGDE